MAATSGVDVSDGLKQELMMAGMFAALGGALVGLLGHTWLWLGLLGVGYLGYHLFQLVRIAELVRRRRTLSEPFPEGLWGDLYRGVSSLQARSRKRKRGLARFGTRFRDAASAIPDALVILDSQSRVDWANPGGAALLGISWPQDSGRPLKQFSVYPLLEELLDAADYAQPLEIPSPQNDALMLSIRIAPFGGKKKQRLIVGRDITKIYHLNQIRRDFVANVSHELRTPLTVIAGFLEEMVHEAPKGSASARPIELMHQQSVRMQGIIEDLLTLSRLELDEKASDLEAVDIAALSAAVAEEAKALSGERGHRVDLNVDRGLFLQANANEMRCVLANLVFNAVLHTPGKTRVSIFWGREDTGAVLAVSDDGPGIPPMHVPRLTERFYRVDKGRSRQSGGTGLGLAIVKHALSRQGAELRIASRFGEGEGATFSCHFPEEQLAEALTGGGEVLAFSQD
jgi:two-component system phosphate regulon sensor histidine kinase PhoR